MSKKDTFRRATGSLLLGGGLFISSLFGYGKSNNNSDEQNESTDREKTEIVTTAKPESVADAKRLDIILDPLAPDFDKQFLRVEDDAIAAIMYAETYRGQPVQQSKENVFTHSYGLTWSRIVDSKTGKVTWVRDYAVNTVYDSYLKKHIKVKIHKPAPTTYDNNIQELRYYLRERVNDLIKSGVLTKKITVGEYVGLVLASYQGDGFVNTISEKLNVAKTQQDIEDAFMGNIKGFGGTLKRRWVSAAFAGGYITAKDILNSYTDGFYNLDNQDFVKGTGKNMHFKMDNQTIKKVLGQTNKQGSVQTEMQKSGQGRKILAKIANTPNKDAIKPVFMRSAELERAQVLYNKKQYSNAAAVFEEIIKQKPTNAAIRNDLALTYIKLEKYKEALKQVNYIIKALEKKSAFGAAYYNAGLCREAMGDVQNAKKNYQLALKHGNKSGQAALNRLEKSKKTSYQQATAKLVSKTGVKKVPVKGGKGR